MYKRTEIYLSFIKKFWIIAGIKKMFSNIAGI